eukprot:maker-scaffold161_size295871-snap-gene-1.38 protein:Tk05108 transcript:maker-scaffold161_size295871-snap-gene-1.38-mRNA-1 annotation:"glycoprotein 3-alpha-l-fucosyltransferase a"
MPRVSIRRVFMYLLAIATLALVTLNIHQSLAGSTGAYWAGISGPGSTGARGSRSGLRIAAALWAKQLDDKPDGELIDSVGARSGRQLTNDQSPNVVLASLHHEANGTLSRRRQFDLSPLDPSDVRLPEISERPWFMPGGKLQPQACPIDPVTKQRQAELLPEDAPKSDRILDQLMFYPPKGSIPENIEDSSTPLKKILLWNGISSWGGTRPGRGVFLKQECPVSSCAISTSRTDSVSADLVLFKDHFTHPTHQRPKNQLWMMYMLECPLHTQMFKIKDVFNWTATYRSDSTIVAPYERWIYYNENVRGQDQGRNFAANKTKAVAWFVSNCGARNGRLDFAKELQKHIQVDIYGSCGTKRCPRSSSRNCFDMLNRDYKFYLAFENSNCKDYITEKFFVNGLGHDILPIVMGARPEDYKRSSPELSYIHVDDFDGPEELADYLHKLDDNDDLYNEYFKWKGTGEFINTKFFCRVCAMLHDPKIAEHQVQKPFYSDVNDWWRGPGTCINGSWRKFQKALEKDAKAKRERAEIEQKQREHDQQNNALDEAPAEIVEGEIVPNDEEAKLP